MFVLSDLHILWKSVLICTYGQFRLKHDQKPSLRRGGRPDQGGGPIVLQGFKQSPRTCEECLCLHVYMSTPARLKGTPERTCVCVQKCRKHAQKQITSVVHMSQDLQTPSARGLWTFRATSLSVNASFDRCPPARGRE